MLSHPSAAAFWTTCRSEALLAFANVTAQALLKVASCDAAAGSRNTLSKSSMPRGVDSVDCAILATAMSRRLRTAALRCSTMSGVGSAGMRPDKRSAASRISEADGKPLCCSSGASAAADNASGRLRKSFSRSTSEPGFLDFSLVSTSGLVALSNLMARKAPASGNFANSSPALRTASVASEVLDAERKFWPRRSSKGRKRTVWSEALYSQSTK
mmetsp:Transcript_31176/g.78486  ORF Transcript_31176/g.78486 Transcript_31176/m.78486 type:complete len:214 (+) Transcript_31176:1166-1807(+)